MTDAAVPILVGTIFLCYSVLSFGASTETITEVEENSEPQASLNGYYLDTVNEISPGVGYVRKIVPTSKFGLG